jgi:hypothetical protein
MPSLIFETASISTAGELSGLPKSDSTVSNFVASGLQEVPSKFTSDDNFLLSILEHEEWKQTGGVRNISL